MKSEATMNRFGHGAPQIMLALLFCLSCGETEPTAVLEYRFAFPIDIKVQDLEKRRISQVPISLNAQVVGYTDRLGQFEMEYWGTENEEIELGLGELEGYRPVTETIHRVSLQKTTAEASYIPVPVVIAAQYEMIIKQYFFWIHAKCDKTLLPSACRDAPITLNGKPVAQTETNGYAEFLHSGIPGKTVTIQIQTPNEELDGINPVSMIPANPTFSVKLDKDPHVYVIERTFSDRTGLEITAKPKSVRANRVKRKPRRSKRKSRTRRKPKKKPSNSGVIDIF